MIDERDLLERALERFEPDPGLTERIMRRRDRKRRNRRIGAGVVGGGIGIALVAIVLQAAVDEAPRQPANHLPSESPARAVEPLPETDYLLDLDTGTTTPLPIVGAKGQSGDYAVSPDGSKLAYARPDDDGKSQIFVANLDGSGVEQITNGRGAMAPAWSPDGTAIAYVGRGAAGEDDNIFVSGLTSEATTQVTFERADVTEAQFSPDGSSILYSAERPDGLQVRIVPATGGDGETVVGGGHLDASSGQLSPDGSLLSYVCSGPRRVGPDLGIIPEPGPNGPGICLANADGSFLRLLVGQDGGRVIGNPRWSPDGTRIAYWTFLLPPGPGFHSPSDVFVVDVATGATTAVTPEGESTVWLDDHTLIVG